MLGTKAWKGPSLGKWGKARARRSTDHLDNSVTKTVEMLTNLADGTNGTLIFVSRASLPRCFSQDRGTLLQSHNSPQRSCGSGRKAGCRVYRFRSAHNICMHRDDDESEVIMTIRMDARWLRCSIPARIMLTVRADVVVCCDVAKRNAVDKNA